MRRQDRAPEADICLILEGSYPYVFGGVSGWTQALMASQPERRFGVIAMSAPGAGPRRYDPPANLHWVQDVVLGDDDRAGRGRGGGDEAGGTRLAAAMATLLEEGTPAALADLAAAVAREAGGVPARALLDGPLGWGMVCALYDRFVPGASFVQFYWTWRALFGGVLSVLRAPLPRAGAYHAVTTGYAGLMAARAGGETGRPVLLTEHGIYTNERRVDLMLADWLHPAFPDRDIGAAPRRDIADFWLMAFESFAQVCYGACRDIVALSAAGRHEQKMLGAPPDRCRVIPNGIDAGRFAQIGPRRAGPPRVALLGRVVPIKDIHCFIRAVAALRRELPQVTAVVAGPWDEDPAYYASCTALVRKLGLEGVLRFPGLMPVTEVLEQSDVLVLTSTSESQPLALLEAGAAGRPCVATDVGACREILTGAEDERPPEGPGGFVTRLAAPEETAARLAELLRDPVQRREMGENLRRRVRRHYGADAMRAAYAGLYADALAVRGAPWRASA
ncbi:GT4 family glycosyltransferase PelF [Salipiger sp. P9]|uniref:GT4 family glycosyltransferase PelF n=1 Tax=Salipiger pentaromativorans TaxID=2943193 RepID=UPI00215787AC|nr:GT4 family glycosyltransferase PelF [Salipiger pentaromativorans]